MAEENKIKSRTYIPKVYYKGELLPYKETPLTIKDVELCKYCKEEITLEQIKHIEPDVNEDLAKSIIKFLNKYDNDFKLDTCLRKAHFISQCLVESNKLKTLKEYMAYSPKSLKSYYKETEHIKLTDANIETYKDKFKIVDSRKEADKKKDKEKKDKYSAFSKLNPAYIYGSTIKKAYQEKIYLNTEKTIYIQVLSHSHNEKEVANRKYSNRTDLGHSGGDDGYNFLGRGIIQLTGKTNYNIFSNYRKKHPFPDDTSGDLDFTKSINSKKLEDKKNPIYAVQSALWYWMIGNGKVYTYSDKDSIENVSKRINGGTNGLEERRDYTLKAKEEKGFKVYKHYEETHKNGTKEEKREVENILAEISKDNILIEKKSNGKKINVNLKDPEAEALFKKLRKQESFSIEPIGINMIPFKITADFKLEIIRTNTEDGKKSKKKRKKKNEESK